MRVQDRRDMGSLDHQLTSSGSSFGSKLRHHQPDFQPPYFPPPYCPLPPPHHQQQQSPSDFLTPPSSADPYAYLASNPYMTAAHPYVTAQAADPRILLNAAGGFHATYDATRRTAVDSYRAASHDIIMASRGQHDLHDTPTSLTSIHQLHSMDDSQTVSNAQLMMF